MEFEKFIKCFAEQFDDTSSDVFKADTRFKDLEEWSSLTALGVMAMAKTQYGKAITGKEIRSCTTVEDLFNLIASK